MRRFAVLLGGTAPATAAALTAFFAGLGLSYLLGRLAPRFARPLRVFAALETGTALSALAGAVATAILAVFIVLGGSASAGDERLQGHIPLLLHPRPHRVA